MKIILANSYNELSRKAADIIEELVSSNGNAVLGLATGSTPVGTYRELIKRYLEHSLDFSGVTTFNLDEYIGLRASNHDSYNYFMNYNLFDHININKDNTHVPDGMTNDPRTYGRLYDRMIENAGGIDLQILGIGSNGHVAFNEPAEELNLGTDLVKLSKKTIEDNSRFFESKENVPTEAISMGIGSIMKARRILLLASGEGKAEAIGQVLNSGKVTTWLPASLLLLHPDVTLICDQEAFSLVDRRIMAGAIV
ncbi:glucosamine-6-phosphate deaminase [Gudongella oleilytica]|uniref:glucosamine-6-phosphate deaminase n=1 Tax=Gudongella oleilytica TaxID=1582259 RepID=UPI000FF88DA6|nr:glucosamine-6-phosphate deaminase [Gudongella oleilytica]